MGQRAAQIVAGLVDICRSSRTMLTRMQVCVRSPAFTTTRWSVVRAEFVRPSASSATITHAYRSPGCGSGFFHVNITESPLYLPTTSVGEGTAAPTEGCAPALGVACAPNPGFTTCASPLSTWSRFGSTSVQNNATPAATAATAAPIAIHAPREGPRLAVSAVAVVAALTMFFKVSTVEVTGSSRYRDGEVAAASGVELGDNLVLLDKYRIAQRIYTELPYVTEARINLNFPPPWCWR